MRRNPEGYSNNYPEPEEPTSWPDVNRRFLNAQRNLDDAELGLDHGQSRESVGWFLQRAMENALKGTLAYGEYDDGIRGAGRWERSHDIERLQNAVNRLDETDALLRGRDFSELTEYAITVQHDGEEKPLEEHRIYREVLDTIQRMMERVEEGTGLGLEVYRREGPRPDPS